jgi:predicted nucleic acid-binding protein
VTLLDTNVILDLFTAPDPPEARWSRARYADALRRGDVGCSVVVVAELMGRARRPEALMTRLQDFEIEIQDLPAAAALPAGLAFRRYRSRGGRRETILPDFLIAGQAAAMDVPFVTRDRRLAGYFPSLTLITPETHP